MFDPDKCVGCHACLVACSIENGSDPGFNLREVFTFNPSMLPGIPHYHLSMACNHCSDPPCVEQCPAAAITKDGKSGIVHIDEKLCIGCRYCSWVCPFGAPVYWISHGVMKKCDLCRERVDDGFKPACESVCPTGALRTEISDPEHVLQEIPFFPDTDIYPAVSITEPGRSVLNDQQYVKTYPDSVLHTFSENKGKNSAEISLKGEWPLIFFTLFISIIGSVFAGYFFGKISVDPFLFFLSGVSGILISLSHLGKKFRSFRIIRNMTRSWLSRESVFFTFFLIASTLSLTGRVDPAAGITGLAAVFLAAFSADMIYFRSAAVIKSYFHSSQVTLTLLLFISYTSGFIPLFIVISLIKTVLYMRRKILSGIRSVFWIILGFLRIVPCLVFPSVILLFEGPGGIFLPALILCGEVLDRGEFYCEFEIINPDNSMNNYFNRKIREIYSDRRDS